MAAPAAQGSLSVIALISGGKDSFYSILHCQANGHRVVALANLYPSGATEKPVAAVERCQTEAQAGLAPTSPQQAGCNHASVPGQLETTDAQAGSSESEVETDLNSFMYQTVGHQIVPLYARATGLPLHRQPIVGTAVHHGLSYENPRHGPQRLVPSNGPALRPSDGHLSPATHDLQGYERQQADDENEPQPKLDPESELEDETESLVPLLRNVLKAHPEANALCTGAILSTYQRTRVESVALRLGLVPLSYLWQFTELPTSVSNSYYHQSISLAKKVTGSSRSYRRHSRKNGRSSARDDARLLRDMAAVGLEARIVKVASAGLDEGFLWENVASEAGVQRVERAMRRFGSAGGRGAVLGEGGEFETLVVDGPPSLFKRRIVVSDENRRVIREGGGCAWLNFRRADVAPKDEPEQAGESQAHTPGVRIPELLDPRFEDTLRCLLALAAGDKQKPRFLNLASSCGDNPAPTGNLGSASSSSSIAKADLPTCQLPLSPHLSSSQEWHYFGGDKAGSLTIGGQTVSIVGQVRRRLAERALPASAITNSVIVLRHMSDFPLVNEHYGSLFHEANPPSRVTVSCGNRLLPKDAAIAVYLTIQSRLEPHERRGLHVQSRSYWAPANIGPYSQAIAFRLLPSPVTEDTSGEDGDHRDEQQQRSHTSSSPLAVSIAGQIPLLPASMALPSPSAPNHAELQITLALQHLWRVGVEMRVRWWTSAVAYFPATPSVESMRHQALTAAAAWKAAHLWPDLDDSDNNSDEDDASDDDEAGPDLWDRRYNAQFMTYGGDGEEESFPLSLPNWNVVEGLDKDVDDADEAGQAKALLKNKVVTIPFFFAAEVEELPRQAGIEWHAHLGLADLQPGSIMLYSSTCDKLLSYEVGPLDLNLHHVIVESVDAVFVQTIATIPSLVGQDKSQRASISTDTLRSAFTATAAALEKLLNLPTQPSLKPKLMYAEDLRLVNGDTLGDLGGLIPCHSLWDSQGRRLGAVCIFETRAAKAS